LFGAPYAVGENPTDPASFVATFTGATAAPNTTNVSGAFDQITDAPEFSNDNIRPYHSMDMVEIIPGGGVIPEPSSAILAMAGIAGLTAMRRRRLASR
jgi:hypothetical protein